MVSATFAILFAAGVLQGFCGFGYSLVALPLICLYAPAQWAVPILAVTSITVNSLVLLSSRKKILFRGLLPMVICGMVFTPLGALLLKLLPDITVRLVIGVTVALSAVFSLSRWSPHLKRSSAGMAVTGVLSGLFNGLTTFSGPPAVIYLSATETEKDSFRGSLSAYFLALTLVSVPSFLGTGVVDGPGLLHAALYLPGAGAGGLLGILVSRKVDSTAFRRIALVVLALLGVFGAVQALG
ncbi:MAG TPA: sulfite exporter TauE/SafE family protein [Candidatus Sabulitectum sp.]|nr:sulfite exporter TauE/SafE family protein [Candidatus Sabulitectum sp.]HPF31475.1 sulfite exporter TauE/SafE family protein [Candidatus Sabulitectum sp.]HPJ29225.1 sulfite exporter TauE/SafE family protein [Candidatus Sabulitectum sp.]HPR22953.1 sulfite exporter TauE/SafE family protein [Candidatus Sabulitectum sp.]